MARIGLSQVTKRFGGTEAVSGLDLDIADGEFVVVVGPSGCGKSTLLRLVAGLEDVSSGDVRIDGQVVNDLPPPERGIAMVFQSYALYPHMTVRKNMAFGLSQAKLRREEIDRRVRAAATRLRIENLLDRKPKSLSGGQRQRVAIGRAIVREPKLFLFDEPLSNLDAALRVEMRMEIAKLRRDLNATVLYVTHDQTEAMTLADRIVILNQGRVEQVGEPLELYRRPRNIFVAGFIGTPAINLLPCTLGSGAEGTVIVLPGDRTMPLPETLRACFGAGEVPSRITLGWRPEAVNLRGGTGGRKDAITLGVEVETVEHLGAETFVHARLDQRTIVTATAGANFQAQPGQRVAFELPLNRCHVFDGEGATLHHPSSGEEG